MTAWILDVEPEQTNQQQTVELDGSQYILLYQWNSRGDRWYLTVYDRDGDVLASSIKITLYGDLLAGIPPSKRPPGQLWAIDYPAGGNTPIQPKDPTFKTFGSRIRMTYLDAEELEALNA